jgi:hypothetical protein
VIETAVASALPGQMPVHPRTRQPLTTAQIEKGKKAKKGKSEGGKRGRKRPSITITMTILNIIHTIEGGV